VFKAEVHRHVVAKCLRTLFGKGETVQPLKQSGVQFCDAIEQKVGRMALEGDAAEDDRRKIAAVDGKPSPFGQGTPPS
jgi:hypothetical protein